MLIESCRKVETGARIEPFVLVGEKRLRSGRLELSKSQKRLDCAKAISSRYEEGSRIGA